MKEWGLHPSVLPFKVQLVNQPVSFYQQYTYQIWSACALFVILVLGLCISLFYYFRTKRLKDELLKSEKDLRVAKDRAEESNRLKSAFLANMSHEIRTPLNSIVGFSDVLAMGGSTEDEQQSYYKIIKTNSDLLLRLINDKFTKRGKITLDFSVNEEKQMAIFSVTDTGCGIPKEKQGLVFERFEKLNEYAQGTGLGLSICKLIVHKWKGSIWIDPDYTGGARFVFSHPLNIEKE